MRKVSLRTQRIWDPFNEEQPGVLVDYGECLANAFRAQADELENRKGWPSNVHWSANELRNTANELEGIND